jgi:hypothetical protein
VARSQDVPAGAGERSTETSRPPGAPRSSHKRNLQKIDWGAPVSRPQSIKPVTPSGWTCSAAVGNTKANITQPGDSCRGAKRTRREFTHLRGADTGPLVGKRMSCGCYCGPLMYEFCRRSSQVSSSFCSRRAMREGGASVHSPTGLRQASTRRPRQRQRERHRGPLSGPAESNGRRRRRRAQQRSSTLRRTRRPSSGRSRRRSRPRRSSRRRRPPRFRHPRPHRHRLLHRPLLLLLRQHQHRPRLRAPPPRRPPSSHPASSWPLSWRASLPG